MRAGDSINVDSGASAPPPPPAEEKEVFEASEVSELPTLLDPAEVQRLMLSLYPRTLRETGIGGRVMVECVIGTDGRPEPGTIRIVESAYEELAEVTLKAFPRLVS
jgi:hypothetical protein